MFLNKNNIKRYSIKTSSGAVFAERFNRTIRDLLKRPVFEKGESNLIHVLPSRTKQYRNGIHSSTKLTPIQASSKKKEVFLYINILEKRIKIKTKFQVNDLVRTADSKKNFSKGNMTNWSYKLYKITETINDTIPTYHIDNFPKRYNEALFRKTELTMKEYNTVMKKLNLS